MPEGYISGTVGRNTADGVRTIEDPGTATRCAVKSSMSPGKVRGYVAKSSCGAN